MNSPFNLTEAAFIAVHAMVIIAKSDNWVNVSRISDATGTSRHHVAKVMLKLVKAGFIDSVRGPGGGFRLLKKTKDITLLDIVEAVDGSYKINEECQLNRKICPFDKCIMEGKLNDMKKEYVQYLSGQRLSGYVE